MQQLGVEEDQDQFIMADVNLTTSEPLTEDAIISIVHPPNVVTISEGGVDDQRDSHMSEGNRKFTNNGVILVREERTMELGCHKLQKYLLEAKTDSSQQTAFTDFLNQPDTDQ